MFVVLPYSRHARSRRALLSFRWHYRPLTSRTTAFRCEAPRGHLKQNSSPTPTRVISFRCHRSVAQRRQRCPALMTPPSTLTDRPFDNVDRLVGNPVGGYAHWLEIARGE